MQILSTEVMQHILERKADKSVDPRLRGRLSMVISNLWRDEEFHDRFEKESHGMSKLTEMAIHGVPYMGISNEHGIKYAIVKKQQSQPLVRLSE